jgi:glycine cleavage system H protein
VAKIVGLSDLRISQLLLLGRIPGFDNLNVLFGLEKERVAMSHTLSELYYSQNHEWLRIEADHRYRVGITDHAQSLLGEIIFVDLPGLGETFIAGENCAVTESVKAASDISSPMSGKIVAINEDLESNPELINHDPYGAGWLFVIESTDDSELHSLLNAVDYQEALEEQEQ